jgi:hypothetical protein
MNRSKETGFNDRLTDAASAKKAQLAKFLAKSKSAANDPAVAERQSAWQAIAVAREVRVAERKAARAASEAYAAAESAASAAALAAEQVARDLAASEQAARDAASALALGAEQKIARDARYAARQARGRK